MHIFSGTSNHPLAQSIAEWLHTSLGNVEITRFIDNECRVYVKDDVKGSQVYVVQSLSEVADQRLVELCLLGQALRDLEAASVTAVIPWMGYSKQDKAFRKGEAVSASLVAKFIESAGFDRVITCELHSQNLLPFFRIPIVEISTQKLLADTLRKISRLSLENNIVVSPDKGGRNRSEAFAKEEQLPIVYLTKTRDRESGEVAVSAISGDIEGKDCIIFDDIINTGATAIKTSEFLKARGAKNISFLATHAVLAGDAAAKLDASGISRVIVTDTIAVPKEKQFKKLTIVSVAPVLTDAIMKQ